MHLRMIVGLFVLIGLFMLAVSLYVGGGLTLICDRQRSVDCKLQTRRWLNQVVMEEQKIFELQRVSVGTRVLDLVAKGTTLRTLMGEPEHVEANGAILNEFLASHGSGPVRVEETEWKFSIAAGIFSGVWLLATAFFTVAFFKKADNKPS